MARPAQQPLQQSHLVVGCPVVAAQDDPQGATHRLSRVPFSHRAPCGELGWTPTFETSACVRTLISLFSAIPERGACPIQACTAAASKSLFTWQVPIFDLALPHFTPGIGVIASRTSEHGLKVCSLLPVSPWKPDSSKGSSACWAAFVSTALNEPFAPSGRTRNS